MPVNEDDMNQINSQEQVEEEEIDYQELAKKILELLKEDLIIENERQGTMLRF